MHRKLHSSNMKCGSGALHNNVLCPNSKEKSLMGKKDEKKGRTHSWMSMYGEIHQYKARWSTRKSPKFANVLLILIRRAFVVWCRIVLINCDAECRTSGTCCQCQNTQTPKRVPSILQFICPNGAFHQTWAPRHTSRSEEWRSTLEKATAWRRFTSIWVTPSTSCAMPNTKNQRRRWSKQEAEMSLGTSKRTWTSNICTFNVFAFSNEHEYCV